MLPLMSNSKIRFKGSSPWANAMMDCGWPSSVTVKSPLVRLLIRSWPCNARTSTRTSATPVLKVGVSPFCAPRGVRMKSVEMKNIIIGTAGHIDHGKTALVGALTGIDTDRLKEEKQRGIYSDLVELVRLEVDEFVRGSFLEDAPVVAVSSTTGAGIAELRAEIEKLAASIHEKDASQYFRLPIDRAFSMRGFGTVVTGTLVSGSVRVEQEVELHPGPERVRVRGIQVHAASVAQATAGQRTALNVAGVDADHLRRGMTLADAGRFTSTRQVDCS